MPQYVSILRTLRQHPHTHTGRYVQPPFLPFPRKPEVAELDPQLAIQQYILQLEIAMDDAMHMQPAYGQRQFAKQPPRLALQNAAPFHEIVKQLAAAAELRDEPYMGLCGDDLVEMDNVGVVEAAVVVELAGEMGGE